MSPTRPRKFTARQEETSVNGMVAEYDSLELPNGGLRSEKLEYLSVEEIYEILQK